MAFNGALLLFGDYPIPNKYIGSYSIASNRRQDVDTYRDADGVLQRNALSHTATTIEFETTPMYNDDMESMMSNIRRNFINYNERNAQCTYYDPENNTHKTGLFYLSDPQWKMSDCDSEKKWIFYGPTRFSLIEY